MIAPKIIFEDDDILVLDKPAGMAVNRAETVSGKTLQDWVEKYLEVPRVAKVSRVPQARDTRGTLDSRDTFLARSGVVHRLDKETSGILLIAKTPQAFVNLQRQFKERKVEKRYLALVHGEVEPEKGEISAPVGRLPWNRERFGVILGGRTAKTEYAVIRYYTLDARPYTLLEITPETGRTHQIRVHLKYIGHSVVGDEKYAGRKTARVDRKWCPRQFLHASYLSFIHPKTGKNIAVSAKLPSDLQRIIMSVG